ncbi:MAG TPA: AAA family ATPase, partial [Spirochaetia bacterium]|nr:AAA family ATPase [Spirochaetia bacterium]
MEGNTLKTQFGDYIKTRGLSLNRAAEAIGYTSSVLSQWMAGEYKGSVDKVEAKVYAWLQLQLARDEAGVVPFVPLKRTERIKAVVRIAHEEKFIALVLGTSGSGKTRALEEYQTENPHTSILIKCDHTFVLSSVVMELAHNLGIDAKGRISEISERIIGELKKRDLIVMFDEADYLTDNVLEYLRIAVNDKGRSALVFAGLSRIEFRIKNLKNDHRQLENRIGILLHVDDVTEEDERAVLREIWDDLPEPVIQVFWKASRKSLHILVRHIILVRRAMKANKTLKPTEEIAAD